MRRLAVAWLFTAAIVGFVSAPPASAADPAQELALRYAPVVRLVEQKEPCAHGEAYEPTNVNLVLGNPEVALHGPWNQTAIVKVGPTADDLSQGLFEYHLDFPGTATSPGCTYDTWSHRVTAGSEPTTYARVVTEAAFPGQLALQYWFFYVFNDFNDKHEGDWEMIQLDFPAGTSEQALQVKPSLVGYSQHTGAESAHWGDSKLTIVDGTHPVVYPALGSHANYYSPDLYLGRSAAEGVGCDDTNGPSRQLRPTVALVPTAEADYLRAFPWLGYIGRWGEQHAGFYNGPTGPNTKDQWTQPITWASTDWRDTAYAVPAGGSVGGTATDFFCGAVATGSNVLTAAVNNPTPVLIALAAFVLLLVWLASRTEWKPSTPFPARGHRRWGAIVASAWRMYGAHPLLFLGLGLLFVPLGLLITGVQWLVFHLTGLSALVDSAGASNAAVGGLALLLGTLFTALGLTVVQAATAFVLAELDDGRTPGAWSAYRAALGQWRELVGAFVVAAIVIGLTGLTAIGAPVAVWLLVRWSLLGQVVALEGRKPRAVLRGSAELVKGSWLRVASLTVFVTGIALLLGPLLGALMLFATSASFDFVNLFASLVYVIALPFAAIATTYLYFDLELEKQRAAAPVEAPAALPEPG